MALVLTSPSCIAPDGKPMPSVVKCLQSIAKDGDVAVVSRTAKPAWFDSTFGDTLKFFHIRNRRDGEIITQNASRLKRKPHEFLVLAGNDSDLAMAKNAGAVLIGAGWSNDQRVSQTGLHVDHATEFQDIAKQLDEWPGSWFWKAELPRMSVRALCDLSTFYKPEEQEKFGKAVTSLVKYGGTRLSALTALGCRSLLSEGVLPGNLAYALYPSSSSTNDDTDTLSETLHAIRTVTSRVRFARRNEPILIRCHKAAKRSTGGTDRTDPTEELNTLCVNPLYRGKLANRTVVLLDDCTAHGLSFSVARALLLAAGAKDVSAVAIGKLGDRFQLSDIELKNQLSCYSSAPKMFTIKSVRPVSGTKDKASQTELIRIFTEAA